MLDGCEEQITKVGGDLLQHTGMESEHLCTAHAQSISDAGILCAPFLHQQVLNTKMSSFVDSAQVINPTIIPLIAIIAAII